MAIQTTCRQCGRVFTPSAQDIRQGTWRRCPPCRDGPDAQGIQSHCIPLQRRRDDPTASTFTHEQE